MRTPTKSTITVVIEYPSTDGPSRVKSVVSFDPEKVPAEDSQ